MITSDRVEALSSIVTNYNVLMSLWEEAAAIDSETIARIKEVSANMEKFTYLFGVALGEMVLEHTDNLSTCNSLQVKTLTVSEGLARIGQSNSYYPPVSQRRLNFWQKVTKKANDLEVDPPTLPSFHKRPKRYEDHK